MEKEEIKTKNKQSWTRWIGGYIIAGLIWAMAQGFRNTMGGEIVVLVIAVVAGFFYYPLKAKIKIGSSFIRVVVTFLIIMIISAIAIGFLTPFANLSLNESNATQSDVHGWTETTKAMFRKDSLNSCGTADPKFCTCLANYLMSKYSFEEIHNMSQDIRNKNASPQSIKDATNYCLSKE